MNNTIRRLSRMSVGNGTFRSEMKEILQNKYVLYAILIIAVLNVIGYLALKNMDAVLFFILTCLLSVYFTRNMIVVLFISVIATNFYVGTRGILSGQGQEGLKNKKIKEGMEADDAEPDATAEPGASGATAEPGASDASGESGASDATAESGASGESGEPDTEMVENNENMKKNGSKGMADKKKKKTQAGMQNLKPAKFKPSKPSGETDAEDDGDESDDDGLAKVSGSAGNRVDYAQTLGQAYDNLQNIIGKDGVKGLTNQTKDLMEQQKVLMNNMKDMEPLIKSAQGFMSQIMGSGGLDGISKLFDGKLFGAIAPAVAENGKSLDK
jgi:hypothetical protein